MSNDSIRQYLAKLDFDFRHGRILMEEGHLGDRRSSTTRKVDVNSNILDEKFDGGFGRAECPPFIAEDRDFIYFPTEYDGSTSAVKVAKSIDDYLENDNLAIPYP